MREVAAAAAEEEEEASISLGKRRLNEAWR